MQAVHEYTELRNGGRRIDPAFRWPTDSMRKNEVNMIGGLTRDEFVEILHKHVSPTSPIQSQEHLFGRERQLQLVEQALFAPGRSVFIYGDRGVGKTSLAQTIAYSHQSATYDPILLACDPQTTFAGLMANAIRHLSDTCPSRSVTTHKLNFGIHGFGIGGERTRQEETVARIEAISDLNAVISELREVSAQRKNGNTVIVVDEFDRIDSDVERGHFADFIKQVGDQRLPVRFIFCGVADSMQRLLGLHASCYRYLDGVELKTLTYEARYEIIDNVASALGVKVDDRPRYRIAAISDGFPHFIHRMCEQLFWQMFNDPLPVETPTADHYREAVAGSVRSIEQHLMRRYDQAVMKDASDYEQALWAVADHSDLTRNTESIYASYLNIMSSLEEASEPLDRQTIVSRLNALKGRSCGNILTSARRGWYRFSESMMRGYVRLRAEEQGCELALDYSAASRTSPELSWRQRGARRSKTGWTPEDWKKLNHPE